MNLYAIKINGLNNPVGFDYEQLLCSWKVKKSCGHSQKWTRIAVSLDKTMTSIIYEKKGVLNSVGEVLEISLEPYTRYYYQITVHSDADEECSSNICYFETAKLQDPWSADWLGVQDGDVHPEFRKTFSISKKIKNAKIYICGLGVFETYLGDKKIGNDLLAPFINDYEEHYQYCTYDVTELLQTKNTWTVLLGDGWYRGHFGLGEPTHYERPLALIAELRICYEDETVEVITTDESWKYRTSFTTLSDIYNGEIQDYYNWKESLWKKPVLIDPPGKLCARYSPAVHYMEHFPVKELIHTPAGEIVLDFGQNFAGHVICTQEIPKGVTLKMEFGEILQNGNFFHDNYRNAKSQFIYKSDGFYREIRPRFTFFGFRYVKISGLSNVDASCFEGRAIYSEMDQTGFIKTGNDKINQLFSNSLWGLKSNFLV